MHRLSLYLKWLVLFLSIIPILFLSSCKDDSEDEFREMLGDSPEYNIGSRENPYLLAIDSPHSGYVRYKSYYQFKTSESGEYQLMFTEFSDWVSIVFYTESNFYESAEFDRCSISSSHRSCDMSNLNANTSYYFVISGQIAHDSTYKMYMALSISDSTVLSFHVSH